MKILILAIVLVCFLNQTVIATWHKGGGCRGGCDNPCSGSYGCGDSAPLLETSGCAGGACVGSSGSGGGYHTKKTTTIVKEERNDEVSLVIGGQRGGSIRKHYAEPEVHHSSGSYIEEPGEIIQKKTIIRQSAPQVRTWVEPVGTIIKKKTTYIEPAPIVHKSHHSHHESYVEEPSVDTVVTKRKTTYVSSPVTEVRRYSKQTYVEPVQPIITRKTTVVTAPVVHKTTVYKEPIVIHKHRYVSSSEPIVENECSGPCGGSKLVKYIKKTTYTDDGGSCQACGDSGSGSGYNSRYESYSEPETIVHKKFTKIISSGPTYSSGNDCYGGDCGSRGAYSSNKCPGGECSSGYGKSGAYAFARASASASADAGSGYGGNSGGGGGCKSGCDEWKK